MQATTCLGIANLACHNGLSDFEAICLRGAAHMRQSVMGFAFAALLMIRIQGMFLDAMLLDISEVELTDNPLACEPP